MMRFVRPVTAQNCLRGRSLGHRGFPSPRSNHNGTDAFDKAREVGKNDRIPQIVCGSAIGTGLGYLIRGTNADKAERVEEAMKRREADLEWAERNMEELRNYNQNRQKLYESISKWEVK